MQTSRDMQAASARATGARVLQAGQVQAQAVQGRMAEGTKRAQHNLPRDAIGLADCLQLHVLEPLLAGTLCACKACRRQRGPGGGAGISIKARGVVRREACMRCRPWGRLRA